MIGEIVIGVRAHAAGVAEALSGVSKAVKKLQEDKKALEDGIKLQFEASGINEMKEQLSELKRQKFEIERNVKFGIESDELTDLRENLKGAKAEIKGLEEGMKFNVDPSDFITAQGKLNELIEQKKNLEAEIKVMVKAEAGEAKSRVTEINKQMLELERKVVMTMETEGISQAQDAIADINGEMKQMQRQSADAGVAMIALGVAVYGAFRSARRAIEDGKRAYIEISTAQVQLNQVMNNTMSATRGQVEEVIALTQAYEQVSSVTARAQQAGAAALSVNLTQVDSLKALLPVLRDVTAQQHGFNASASQASSVATMLGRVIEGNTMAAQRYGFVFSEAQKEILRYGEEMERVAVVVEVIGGAVGGLSEKFANMDAGSLGQLTTETRELSSALGGAVVPAKALAAEGLIPVISGMREFIEENGSFVAGLTASSAALVGVIAVFKLYQVEAGKKILSNVKLLASINPIAGALAALAVVGAGAFVSMQVHIREVKRELEEFENMARRFMEAMNSDVDTVNIIDVEDGIEGLRQLKEQAEEFQIAAERAFEAARMGADEQGLGINAAISGFNNLAERAYEMGVTFERTGNIVADYTALLEALAERSSQATNVAEQVAEYARIAESIEDAARALEEYSAAIDETIGRMRQLETAYERLSRGEKLSTQSLLELIRLHPQVAEHIRETGDLTLRNGEILREVAAEEQAAAQASIEANIRKTELQIEKTEMRINSYEAEVEALRNLQRALGELDSSMDGYFANAAARIREARAEIAGFREQLSADQAALITFEATNFGSSSARRGGGSGRAGAARNEAQELYRVERQIHDDKVFFSEMSLREQIENLEELRKRHMEYADGVRRMDRELFTLRRQLLQETAREQMRYIEQISAREDGTFDFEQKIELAQKFYQELMESYAEHPATVMRLTEELNDFVIRATENRVRQVAEIERTAVDEMRKAFDENLLILRRQEELSSARAGLVVDGHEQTFGAIDRLRFAEETLAQYDRQIAIINAKGAEITEAEKQWLENLYRARADVYHRIQVLTLNAEREVRQEITRYFQQSLREREQALREHHRVVVSEIRARFAEEIRLAEEAANAEIRIYEDKLRGIDNLIRDMERSERNESQQDRINRLQAQLDYEADDGNRYQLQRQIDREQAEMRRRQNREALDDERAAIRDRIVYTRNNLAEQRSLLQKQRDEEIRMVEESLEAHIAGLDERLKADKGYNESVTENLLHHLSVRDENTTRFYRDEEAKARENQRNNFRIVETGTNNILRMLFSAIDEFAEAGRRAGLAWAAAFQAATAHVSVPGMSSSAGFAAHSSYAGFSQPIELTLNQKIEVVEGSPAYKSKKTKLFLEDAARYK